MEREEVKLLRLHEARELPRKRVEELRLQVLELLHCGQDAKTACEEAGIMPSVFSQWLRDDSQFAEDVCLAMEMRVFWAEEALYRTALGGSVTAQRMYLLTMSPEKWMFGRAAPLHGHERARCDRDQDPLQAMRPPKAVRPVRAVRKSAEADADNEEVSRDVARLPAGKAAGNPSHDGEERKEEMTGSHFPTEGEPNLCSAKIEPSGASAAGLAGEATENPSHDGEDFTCKRRHNTLLAAALAALAAKRRRLMQTMRALDALYLGVVQE